MCDSDPFDIVVLALAKGIDDSDKLLRHFNVVASID